MLMRLSVLITFALLIVGCQDGDRRKLDDDRAAAMQSLQPISLTRTGGVTGVNDRITIAPDGAIEYRVKAMTPLAGSLTEFQRLQLVRIFDDLKRVAADRYAPERPTPDAITTTLKYGERTVTVVDGASNVPQEFITARDRVQELARQLNRR
jgi:hypothetical protein